ncbi:MAG: hypothetical protein ACOYM0_13180 [Bacteroidales bacterium]
MKKIILVSIGLLCLVSVYAQNDLSQPQKKSDSSGFNTVFGGNKHRCKVPLGYFVEISGAYTMVGSNNAFMPGLSAGIILNHHWTIGLTGSMLGMPRGFHYDSIYLDTLGRPMKGAYLKGGYGGLLLEYTLLPKSVVHVSFPLMIGMGYMFFRSTDSYNSNHNNNWNNNWNNYVVANTYCFVIEPGVRAEFNLVKILRMGVTVSYRYAPGFSLSGISASTLNQFNAKLSFRFGKF